MKRMVFAAVTVLIGCVGAAADEMPKNVLSEAALKAKVTKGWYIYGLTPSGNVFKVSYKADGTLVGQTHKDGDQGKWWIKDNKLCRHWGKAWSRREGKEQACFVVALEKKCVHFHMPDGEWYRTWTTVSGLDPEYCDK